jgi:hypothetical protein
VQQASCALSELTSHVSKPRVILFPDMNLVEEIFRVLDIFTDKGKLWKCGNLVLTSKDERRL